MLKNLVNAFAFRLLVLLGCTVAASFFAIRQEWIGFAITIPLCLLAFRSVWIAQKRNTQKIAFMFNAIENADYTFKYATEKRSSDDRLVNESLNRIVDILSQAKAEAIRKEKYYELIINNITTGIIVIDDSGYIYQTNKGALMLLGLPVFTHVEQLRRVDENLAERMIGITAGERQQVSFNNEKETRHLSIRVSEMTLQEKHIRIIVINDINSELDDKEIDSWIRLTRVLTHEIMNAITPVTSLSESLLSIHENADKEIRDGLEVISATGRSLISFVSSYRKFTHIPQPYPALFYVGKFAERMVRLATHHNNYPNIGITVDVQPESLIVYADENLIAQVVLNLLKNAMEAIGKEQSGGHIEIKGYCNEDEAVFIEVTNNGPAIPPEDMKHIFVPFFTTKESGSGVGLSISRQIMRLSGGSIALNSFPATGKTTFVLTFP